MVENTFLQWPPQPSTVIGLGILTGTLLYIVTGDSVWAGVAAAAVKILVPDNSTRPNQVFSAINILAQAVGRPIPAQTVPGPTPGDVLTALDEPQVRPMQDVNE